MSCQISPKYDEQYLRKAAEGNYNVDDIGCIGKYSSKSIFVLSDGKVLVMTFGGHLILLNEARKLAGYRYTYGEEAVSEYATQSGVVSVSLRDTNLTIMGERWTKAQIKSIRDIMMYAEIDNPEKVEVVLDGMTAEELCRGL